MEATFAIIAGAFAISQGALLWALLATRGQLTKLRESIPADTQTRMTLVEARATALEGHIDQMIDAFRQVGNAMHAASTRVTRKGWL